MPAEDRGYGQGAAAAPAKETNEERRGKVFKFGACVIPAKLGAADSDSSLSEPETRRKRKKRGSGSKRRKAPSDSDSSTDSEGAKSERRGRRRRGRRDPSISGDDDGEDDSDERRRRKRKKKRKPKDDGTDSEEKTADFEITRKEMGLEWMLKSAIRTDNGHPAVEADGKKDDEVNEVKRANPRELNPYLKDNGSGYPEDSTLSKTSDQLLASSVVGDGGASWRLKALKRAKEQAAREGRNLDEVVGERWGSLGRLAASVASSTAAPAPAHAHLHAIRKRKGVDVGDLDDFSKDDSKGRKDGGHGGVRDYLRGVSSRHPEMRKPREDSLSWKKGRGPRMSSEEETLISTAVSSLNKFDNDGSFMDKIGRLQSSATDAAGSTFDKSETIERVENDPQPLKQSSSNQVSSDEKQVLSINQLAAKVLQLRMKGKHEEAGTLEKEMKALHEEQGAADKMSGHETRRRLSSNILNHKTGGRNKRREEDADAHIAKKIMQSKQYSWSKSVEDEYDFEGEAPARKAKRKTKEGTTENNRSAPKQLLTQKERCMFCFENPSRPKHLVISIANFTYLMLPQLQPVVPGHCIILPLQHESSTRTVDQDVWEEIRNFKKCLLKMFALQDKGVLFVETVISLEKQRRHCMIECIPIPIELSDDAPMYFKKAIDEAEEEWGQHEMKKLIPTKGNLRQVIPEHFAYFHVEFGLDRGFVHVIDDDSNFSGGFALNVVRGMLQLPDEDMHRRRRNESVDTQKKAMASFVQHWRPFDWTSQLD